MHNDKRLFQKWGEVTSSPQAVDHIRIARRSAVAIAGFTIIEVLIVLAIAGLILLIVFLALPALQRNTRNSDRKQAIGRVVTAYNNIVSNSGHAPQNVGDLAAMGNDVGNTNQYGNGSSSSLSGIFTNDTVSAPTASQTNIPFGFYLSTGGVTYTGAETTSDANGVVIVDEQQKCGTSPGVTIASLSGSTTTPAAILYSLETSTGNWTWGCTNAQ